MTGDGDALGTLGWGLRRYAWLVLLCVLGLGVAVPVWLHSTPKQYQAQAMVGPAGQLNLGNVTPLPRFGASVFSDGAVASAVRMSYSPPLPTTAKVISKQVSLIAPQENIVFGVVGTASTPQQAARLANIAANAFAVELNKYKASVGAFAVQAPATSAGATSTAVIHSTKEAAVIGLLVGLLAGVGVVALILARRRPVLGMAGVAEAAGPMPVYRLDFRRDEVLGAPRLSHQLLSLDIHTLLLAGSAWTAGTRVAIAKTVQRLLAGGRPVTILTSGEVAQLGSISTPSTSAEVAQLGSISTPSKTTRSKTTRLLVVTDPAPTTLATRTAGSIVLLVAAEGIPRSRLRTLAGRFLDDGDRAVVLVRRQRRALPRARGLVTAMRAGARKASVASRAAVARPMRQRGQSDPVRD
jgi:hypothetical protein